MIRTGHSTAKTARDMAKPNFGRNGRSREGANTWNARAVGLHLRPDNTLLSREILTAGFGGRILVRKTAALQLLGQTLILARIGVAFGEALHRLIVCQPLFAADV